MVASYLYPMEFQLNGQEYIELNKLLKLAGLVGTGGEANMLIDSGEVKVNGNVETRRRNKIKAGFEVELDGNVVTVVA